MLTYLQKSNDILQNIDLNVYFVISNIQGDLKDFIKETVLLEY